MDVKPLPAEDAGILRDYAIPHFKSRFPEYAGLDLRLESDSLIVNCHETDPLNQVLREIWEINSKARIAIGISRANLEFNGTQILKAEEVMVALLEEEKISNLNGNIPEEIINMAVPEKQSAPESIKLIPLSEVLTQLGLEKKEYDDLLKCLDHAAQRHFKDTNSSSTTTLLTQLLQLPQKFVDLSMQPIELHQIGNTYAVKEKDIQAVRAWYKASKVPLMLRAVQDNIKAEFADIITESPEPEAAIATEAPPKRRGRKAKTETEASTSTESRPKPININIKEDDTVFSNVLKNSRYKQAADKILAALKNRKDEFLVLAVELDPIAVKAMDKLLVKFISEESRRETVKSNIFKHLAKIAPEATPEGEADAAGSDF